MKFKTHNEKTIQIGGTSLQGSIYITYNELKKKFGKPSNGDGYKIDAEWDIEFDNGMVATIYNYKDGKNYNGKEGTPKTKITDWHVGGKTNEVLDLLDDILF